LPRHDYEREGRGSQCRRAGGAFRQLEDRREQRPRGEAVVDRVSLPRPGAPGGRRDVDLHRANRAMTVHIVHIGDLHFGGLADVPVVEALERMLPDLRPDAIVIGGDLSQRARPGEVQRGRAFANLCRETAPVLVIPGNHDVQWWRRPLIPFGKDIVYEKYRSY